MVIQEIFGVNAVMRAIAGEDQFMPKAAQGQVVAALGDHSRVEIHRYPGRGHAFARKGGDHHDAGDAALAQSRTLAFFSKNL
ncbi:MAG: dienelactone hydrolase family protein [Caulobacteraceae bacterium]